MTPKLEKNGFSLVEVLVALGVIMIGIGAALTTIIFANKTAITTANQMYSVHEAREQLELLRRFPVTDPAFSLGNHSLSGGAFYVVSSTPTNIKTVVMSAVWTNMVTRKTVTSYVTTVFSGALH